MEISIVIPVLNEQQSLAQLHREIDAVAAQQQYDIQIIFVDDGSIDESWSTIEQIAAADPRVIGIRLRRNFGKSAALAAGLSACQNDVIATIDADLQDDPAELPKMVKVLGQPWDVVGGWKISRQDPWHKRAQSRMFNRLVNLLTGLKLRDHNTGLKLFRREVADMIGLYGEMHRFLPVLASAYGFRVGEVPVNHRPRKYGHSKYNSSRIIKAFLDLLTVMFLTSFRHRPQHFLGSAGLLSFLAGLLILVGMAGYWGVRMIFWQELTPVHQRPLVLYGLAAMLLGIHLLTFGWLAELIVFRQRERHPPFAIAKTTRHPTTEASEPSRPLVDQL